MLDTLVLNKLLPSNPWSTYDVLPWQDFAKNQLHLSRNDAASRDCYWRKEYIGCLI